MTQTRGSITIPTWANGPDASGNGGYSAGLLGELLPDSAAVTVSLRQPPPLGRALDVVQLDDDHLELHDGGLLVAEATTARLDWTVPDDIRQLDPARAAAARAGFAFRGRHPFPHCIACGDERDPSLPSLALHCGPVEELHATDDAGCSVAVYADSWAPEASLAEPADPAHCTVAACWAALDCPSAAPFANPDAEHPSVLARITVSLTRPARVGEPHIVAAWQRGVDGRKQYSSSVLIDAVRATVIGRADALWIEVRPR